MWLLENLKLHVAYIGSVSEPLSALELLPFFRVDITKLTLSMLGSPTHRTEATPEQDSVHGSRRSTEDPGARPTAHGVNHECACKNHQDRHS